MTGLTVAHAANAVARAGQREGCPSRLRMQAAVREADPRAESMPGTPETMAARCTRRVPYLPRYRAISSPPVECTAMSGPRQVIGGQGGH
jgi:hypothetical protein